MKGENEKLLFAVLNEAYPKKWVSEHKGIEGRKFRFDCANPSQKIAIEIEGGIWVTGRHNRPLGMEQDMEKYNMAVLEGWKVLRYPPDILRKSPWRIIRDVRMLCGASTDAAQTALCLDNVKSSPMQMQVKLGV